MSEVFKLEGLADLESAMMDMSRSINIGIARRALINAAQPLVDMWSELAPVDEGHYERSVAASTKLSRRQAAMAVKESEVEVYVGPDNAPQAVQQEFGNRFAPPQPAGRPAWDATRHDVMFNIRDELIVEVGKAAERAASKQARLIAQAKS